ncbi:unnamed protein product [Owenia fusiformis]|uniref:Uncharacterized protein n=1 Tax=Owenia fusiformis TaxID=6347 RepID=A0A8J1Y1W4_OWEFU|nr:unnamed protein product [Owenia fusiformis]
MPRKSRSTDNNPYDALQSSWDTPYCRQFLQLTRHIIDIPKFSIQEFEFALKEFDDILINYIFTQLLRFLDEVKSPILLSNFDIVLGELLAKENPRNNQLHRCKFKHLRGDEKVQILRWLVDYVFDKKADELEEYFDDNFHPNDLRAINVGQDAFNNTYWYFDDLRLYKEAGSKKSGKKDFETICITLPDWQTFVKQFRKTSNVNEKLLHDYLTTELFPLVSAKLEAEFLYPETENLEISRDTILKREAVNNPEMLNDSSKIMASSDVEVSNEVKKEVKSEPNVNVKNESSSVESQDTIINGNTPKTETEEAKPEIKSEVKQESNPGDIYSAENIDSTETPNGLHPQPPLLQQPAAAQPQTSTSDSHYMQQHSQIFVYSTGLANKASESVLNGTHKSIIEYHCEQPGTKKFLQKHPLKVSQFNRPAGLPNYNMANVRGPTTNRTSQGMMGSNGNGNQSVAQWVEQQNANLQQTGMNNMTGNNMATNQGMGNVGGFDPSNPMGEQTMGQNPIGNMPSNMPPNYGGMGNMPPNSMSNIPPNSMGNMPPNSMGNMPPNMPPNSMGNVPPSTMGNMPPNTMGNMLPSTMGNMPQSSNSMGNGAPNAPPSTMGNMPPQSMGNLPPQSMGNMPPTSAPGTMPPGPNPRMPPNGADPNMAMPGRWNNDQMMSAAANLMDMQEGSGDIQTSRIPNENLTPEQLQRREESLANLRKIQQMLFPEKEGGSGPPGSMPSQNGPPGPGGMPPQGPNMMQGPGGGGGPPDGMFNMMNPQQQMMSPHGPSPNMMMGQQPMGPGGPPMSQGGPPMTQGGPSMGPGGPPMGPGGPPMGPGGPMGPGPPHNMMSPQPNMMMTPYGIDPQNMTPAQRDWMKLQQEYYTDKQRVRQQQMMQMQHMNPGGDPFCPPGGPNPMQGPPPPYFNNMGGRRASMTGTPTSPNTNGPMPSPHISSGHPSPSPGGPQFDFPGPRHPGFPSPNHPVMSPGMPGGMDPSMMGPGGMPMGPGGMPMGPGMGPGMNMGMGPGMPHQPTRGRGKNSRAKTPAIVQRAGNPEPLTPEIINNLTGPNKPPPSYAQSTKRKRENGIDEANKKLQPTPSPQQMNYMNVYEGQELTITKQMNSAFQDSPQGAPTGTTRTTSLNSPMPTSVGSPMTAPGSNKATSIKSPLPPPAPSPAQQKPAPSPSPIPTPSPAQQMPPPSPIQKPATPSTPGPQVPKSPLPVSSTTTTGTTVVTTSTITTSAPNSSVTTTTSSIGVKSPLPQQAKQPTHGTHPALSTAPGSGAPPSPGQRLSHFDPPGSKNNANKANLTSNITSASLANLAKGVEHLSNQMQQSMLQGGPFHNIQIQGQISENEQMPPNSIPPHSSIPPSGPPSVNNTYVNATMSIQQLNIQSVNNPGGMSNPAMQVQQMNNDIAGGTGPGGGMNEPLPGPATAQASQMMAGGPLPTNTSMSMSQAQMMNMGGSIPGMDTHGMQRFPSGPQSGPPQSPFGQYPNPQEGPQFNPQQQYSQFPGDPNMPGMPGSKQFPGGPHPGGPHPGGPHPAGPHPGGPHPGGPQYGPGGQPGGPTPTSQPSPFPVPATPGQRFGSPEVPPQSVTPDLMSMGPVGSPPFRGPNPGGPGGAPPGKGRSSGVHVQAKAPNTIGYMPNQGGPPMPQQVSDPVNVRPEMEMMSRYATPMKDLESKLPTKKLQYFPNANDSQNHHGEIPGMRMAQMQAMTRREMMGPGGPMPRFPGAPGPPGEMAGMMPRHPMNSMEMMQQQSMMMAGNRGPMSSMQYSGPPGPPGGPMMQGSQHIQIQGQNITMQGQGPMPPLNHPMNPSQLAQMRSMDPQMRQMGPDSQMRGGGMPGVPDPRMMNSGGPPVGGSAGSYGNDPGFNATFQQQQMYAQNTARQMGPQGMSGGGNPNYMM